jgi:hypothetical protein
MIEHRLPERQRKNMAYAPKGSPHTANQWTLGHARALKLVASCERAGHQTVIAQLNMVIRTKLLTQPQAEEVMKELLERRKLVDECTRTVSNAQARIDQQLDKLPRYVSDAERKQYTVPGPNPRPADLVKLDMKAITAPQFGKPSAQQAKQKQHKADSASTKAQPVFDRTNLTSAWFTPKETVNEQ